MTIYSFPLNGASLRGAAMTGTPAAPTGLRREMDRLVSEVFGAARPDALGQSAAFAPAADAIEDAASFTLTLDLPGVRADKLDVLAEEGVLTIRGERIRAAANHEGARTLFAERSAGSFERRFRLPKAADSSAIEATLQDGELTVRVAKVAPAHPRRVPVNGQKADVSPERPGA